MEHPIYRVVAFEKTAPFTLKLTFDDDTSQTINFCSVLRGPLYGALADEYFFDQVSLDVEVHTLVWPNGVDFDPATLHGWPMYEESMVELAKRSEEKVDA